MPEYHQAVYVISVAAELAGVHPQTLRIYERKGLVEPGPHPGRQPPLQRRRHRAAAAHPGPDQRGPQPGGGEAGVALEAEVARLERQVEQLRDRAAEDVEPSTASTAGTWCR